MKFLDADHPFFRRAWVRWATVIVPACWGMFEAWMGNLGWAGLFGAVAGYAFWELILRGPSRPDGT